MPTRVASRHLRHALGLLLVCVAVFLLGAASADAGGGVSRSALGRPDRPDPVLLLLGPTAGGVPGHSTLRPGVSGALVFPPSAAAEFLGGLHEWNTALVFQAEYRSVDTGRDLVTGEALLRRGFGGERPGRPNLFVGFGGGLMRAGYLVEQAAEADAGGGGEGEGEETTPAAPVLVQQDERAWTMLFECGYSLQTPSGPVVLVKGQWRHAVCRVADYSGWTLHVQAGIPIPW